MIAINKKKSLDMFKSQQKKREHQWFPKLREISCKAGNVSGRTDSQSSLSCFYNIDERILFDGPTWYLQIMEGVGDPGNPRKKSSLMSI